jgi:pSer/pThr/pTyr-binding forkhead associated (FHA) protein
MDFHLQNVQTGETVKLDPEGTLIGTADHATIRATEGGPLLGGFVVRYPMDWALFGLSDDPSVTYNRQPLRPGQRVTPTKGALFTTGEDRFTFLCPQSKPEIEPFDEPMSRPICFAYITFPDGKEECRAVDHDLLFGRSEFCHVQLADTRLSRLNALLAFDSGDWYIHNLTKKVIGRNRKSVRHFARIADGDELLIGPLVVRVELRPVSDTTTPLGRDETSDSTQEMRRPRLPSVPGMSSMPTDFPDATDDGSGERSPAQDLEKIREHAELLDLWLKAHPPQRAAPKTGLGAWLDAQRDRLKRFWLDTPETTSARSLRTAGRVEEAFNLLERAIRTRYNSPDLLRELYRLYDSLGFDELCYRPLRQIEKLAELRGTPDPWVLETLAHLCERLGRRDPSMTDRAIKYWTKLEAATGTSRTREKADVMARRALRENGYAGADGA